MWRVDVGKGEATRARLIEKTAELITVQGYHATGLNQITQESSTPMGSLYYHFRGGKDALVGAAMEAGGSLIAGALTAAFSSAPDIPSAVRTLVHLLAEQLENSGFRKGCPIATVTLETAAENGTIQKTAQIIYQGWQAQIAAFLVTFGYSEPAAASAARFALVVIEGGLLLSRAEHSTAPLTDAGEHLIVYLTSRSEGA